MKSVLAPALLLLAACGAKGPLVWPEGKPPPQAATQGPLSSETMLEPPPQAAPARVDDPVRESKERGDDEFDLPPTSD